jgi:hypothetical protein
MPAYWLSFVVAISASADEQTIFERPIERLSNKIFLSPEFIADVRMIRQAIVQKARESTLQGDERTAALVRSAAIESDFEFKYRCRSTILALAIAFDTGEQCRKSVLTQRFWKTYESDDERRQRLRVLGQPTILGRKDLPAHFFVAAGLVAITTQEQAEAACILKEVNDASGGTGFSFIDLAAGQAGIIYSLEILSRKDMFTPLVRDFQVAKFMPHVTDLPEGINIFELRDDFSFDGTDRFREMVRQIRMRSIDLPIYRTLPVIGSAAAITP